MRFNVHKEHDIDECYESNIKLSMLQENKTERVHKCIKNLFFNRRIFRRPCFRNNEKVTKTT